MTKIEIALSYLEKGLSVIPLYSPEMLQTKPPRNFIAELKQEYEKNNQLENPLPKEVITKDAFIRKCKAPCVSGWKEYQHRLPTKEEVNHWFNTNPDANIGIITGTVSNLVVFDFDSTQTLEYVQEIGGMPESTVIVKTGKGFHFYMQYPDFAVGSPVNTNFRLDIRADGGYVVAPPSIHGSGSQYEWVEGSSIMDVTPAPCTPWMIDYLKGSKNETKPDKKQTETPPVKAETIQPNEKEIEADKYSELLKNGCIQGGRNNSTLQLVGHLFKTGLKETEIWEMVQIWNKDKVNPPLGHDELKGIFESIKTAEKKSKDAKIIQIDSYLDDINQAVADYQKNYVRIPFANNNLINLEKMMSGGFAGGRFYLFGGIPAAGKTVLLNNIADNICLNNYPVLFFSYDDGKAELRYRSFSRFTKQPIEEFNKCHKKDIQGICQLPNIKQIMSLKYVVQQMITIEKWPELIEQITKKHGKSPVIIIDYLRKLRTEKNSGDERLRVDNILSKLTEIAKTYNTPVIAISELARDSYKSGQRLSLASLKESGMIEYEASWLGILAAVEIGKNGEYIIKDNCENLIKYDGNIDLIVFKTKRGTGDTGRIPLKVDKNFMTVSDRPVEPAIAQQTIQKTKKTKY